MRFKTLLCISISFILIFTVSLSSFAATEIQKPEVNDKNNILTDNNKNQQNLKKKQENKKMMPFTEDEINLIKQYNIEQIKLILAAKLKEGSISKLQYDTILANLNDKKHFGIGINALLTDKEKEELREKQIAFIKNLIEKKVENGTLTREEANELIKNISKRPLGAKVKIKK